MVLPAAEQPPEPPPDAYLVRMKNLTSTALSTALTAGLLAAAAPAALADDGASMTPDAALQKLMDGNARFVAGELEHPNLSKEVRETLAQGQNPYAVIVGCADSRVPPELLFDAGPGDLFVIRVAGNVVDDFEQASIEYAVAVLETPLVVVLGHESCGAVDAAVKAERGEASFEGHIHDLVEEIRESVESAMDKPYEGDLLDAAVAENANRVKHQLTRSQPYVGPAVEDGKVKLVAARYDLDTGEVTRVDEHDKDGMDGHDHD